MGDSKAQRNLPEQTAPSIRIGERFGERYRIEQLIGRGGMGTVFRVHDLELDETVALKLLEVSSASEDAIERFRREVRLARRVTHRNAARTYDLGEHGGLRFLTMEFVDGESLAELAARGRMASARALDITRQIAEGLAAAHAAEVIHRDLKPANVLVESGGRVVITDFGIARVHSGEDTLNTHGTPGTPAYMAPEQLAGERVTPAADVYALGLIMHELLTGELPYARKSTMETALARLHESPPDLSSTHDVEPDVANLLALMLSLEPAERPDPASIVNALGEHESELLARARQHDSSELSMPAPIRRLALAVLPFLHRGPPDTAYISEVLSDELIDLLAMTKGLRVSASGATARYAERRDRDPRAIGRELGVDALIDGTVQVAGQRVRISARLLDGETGFQRWSERFEGSLGDIFELQDTLCKRIAEALRVQVEESIHHGDATPEAIEHYMRARQLARAWTFKGPEGAVAYFSRSLELAPAFKPALAGYALACTRAYFLPADPEDPDWEAMSAAAVDVALGWAPELAETHLAAARWAVAGGDYRGAAQALRLALTIAPTYAAAHEYIGRLQLEHGRAREGMAHLEQALELDPSLIFCLPTMARHHALRGEYEVFRSYIERYYASDPPLRTPALLLEARIALWRDDPAELAELSLRLRELLPERTPMAALAELLWRAELDAADYEPRLEAMLAVLVDPHTRASVLQIACEAAAARGHTQLGLHLLERAMLSAQTDLVTDLDWLEHCPALEPLREEQLYRQALATARARAQAIWWARSSSRR